MDSAKLNDWMQVIGIFALVASLVFVGLQMKQSQEIAIAEQFHNRAVAVMGLAETQMEIGEVPNVRGWRERVSNGEVLAVDINSFHWLWISFDNHYYQYQSGFMEESAWQAQLRNARGLYTVCDMRFVYDWRKSGLRAEFVDLVGSFEDTCVGSD
jgi:hypothetical protein